MQGNEFLSSHKKTVLFCVFTLILLSNKIQFEFEYLHTFNIFCMKIIKIDIEYINVNILQKSQFGEFSLWLSL